MTKEEMNVFTRRITQSSKSELVVITYDIIINYIESANKEYEDGSVEGFIFNLKKEDVFSGIGRFFRKRKTDMLRLKTSLTPLAGFSDSSFRKVCKRFGADAVTTEMVSAKGLLYKNVKTTEMLRIDDGERPTAIQLFGSVPAELAEAGLYHACSLRQLRQIGRASCRERV